MKIPLFSTALHTLFDVENVLQAADKLELCSGGAALYIIKGKRLSCA